ncbi:hypothetical protein IGI37_003799 [Enterococcus sp. AZ194]|uniref:helix-turn-helix domain-containing protein n=1 Tax=Enterococcus sp. AZ194 TaxID=2774629 RepID=UPI003F23D04F
MEYSGKTYKYFREAKNFSVTQASEGIVSPQFLRKYESATCDISMTNFFQLLARINVTLTEFLNIYNEDIFDIWFVKCEKALDGIGRHDSIEADRLLDEWRELAEKNPDIRFTLMLKCLEHLYYKRFHQTESLCYKEVTNYLREVETWGNFEFFIATYTDFPLSTEELLMVANKILKMKEKYRNSGHIVYDFLVHVGSHFFNLGDLEKSKYILESYFSIFHKKDQIFFISFEIYARFYLGLIEMHEYNIPENKSCLTIISTLNMFDTYTGYANFMNMAYQKERAKIMAKNQ